MTELEKEMKASRKRLARVERILAESAAEGKKRMAEFDERLRKEEAAREKRAAERKKEAAEFDELLRKRAAKFAQGMEEIRQNIGGFTNAVGEALEDEFYAALDESRRVGGIALTDVKKRIAGFRYEYDLVGRNGKFMLVGEIKHTLGGKEVRHFAENRLPYFAKDFPGEAKGRKILGMVGGNRITPKAREEAAKRGLIILRLRNKKLVVENESAARPTAQV